MSIDKANERTSKEDSSVDLALSHKRNSKLDSNVTTLESGRGGGGGAQQRSSSQSTRPSSLKRLLNALCCISEHDDEKDTVLADLSHAAVTAGGDMALSGQVNNPRYVNAQAPLYEPNVSGTATTKAHQQPNDKLILDKPVPPLPGTAHHDDDNHNDDHHNNNDHTNLSNTNNDDNFPTNNDRDDVDEDAIRHAATSVQSPTANNEMLEKTTPEEEAADEEELLASPAPDRWLLEPLTEELNGRKCLVLDLDETLVHSSFKFLPQADFVIPVEIDDQFHNVYVIKRPGVDEFMRRVGELFEVVVFTASVSKYGDPLLDQLDIHNVVHHRLFRESCYNLNGNYVKNLSQLGRPLNDVIIIDNSPASYVLHPQHAVPVSSWFSDAHDNELLDMIPFLEDLAHASVNDVSQVLDVNIFL